MSEPEGHEAKVSAASVERHRPAASYNLHGSLTGTGRQGAQHVIRVSLVIIACLIMAWRFTHRQTDDALISHFSHASKKQATYVRGVVEDEPSSGDDSVKFTLRVLCMSDKEADCQSVKNTGADSLWNNGNDENHLLLVKSHDQKISYGDEVFLLGQVKKPEIIKGDDGRIFDYPAYLSKDGIFYTFDAGWAEVKNHDYGYRLLKLLYRFKQKFVEQLNMMLPSPHSFLAGGLIISGKGSLSPDLQLEFQKVGLIHIVVLSGFNVTIVGESVMRLLAFLPRVISVSFGAVSIVLFSLMVGGGSTVLRSMIMSLIGLYARLTDRKNGALVSLTVTAFIMLMINPMILLYDPSFQMSFAATLGLILLSEPYEIILRRLAGKHRVQGGLLSLVASTLSTQTFTVPLIMRFSGIVSVVALPVNIIILPVIPLTMLLVFLTASISFMSVLAATPFAFVSWLFLCYELLVVRVASSLSFAALMMKPVDWPEALVMYALIIVFVFWIRSVTLDRSRKHEEEAL